MRKEVAVIGAGMIHFGELFDKSVDNMIEEAYINCLKSVDNGIEPKEIEAAWLGSAYERSGASLAIPTGLFRIPISRNENGCATGSDAFRNACYAVKAGIYKVVLVCGVEKMRDAAGGLIAKAAAKSGIDMWRYRARTMPAFFGLRGTRHFHEFGSKREHLAMISVKNHHNGYLYPYAHYRFECTIEQVLNAPLVSWPLGLYDSCPITDGACCVLIASADVAKNYTDTPIWWQGAGCGVDSWMRGLDENFIGFPATVIAAKEAYKMAGITPKDIQVAEVHDCFTVTEMLDYEDLGFCKKGEGHKMIEEGIVTLDGALPINPSGGLIAKGHPIGASGVAQIAEIYEQLRGTAGKVQVPDVEIGLQHNIGLGRGATGSASVVNILRR
ncbi:MAG: thiolase C-terminal domain-containing protein [Candidatus Helarchaeota archaeon]